MSNSRRALSAALLLSLCVPACRTHEVHSEREVRVVERGPEEREHRRDREREMLEQQNEALRVAMHGLMEVDHPERAERLEHALHARELRMEGRRDREAIEIMKSAPNAGQTLELVHAAKKAWVELGHHERAEVVERLEVQLRERWEHERQRREHEGRRREQEGRRGEHEGRRRERRERGRDDAMGRQSEEIRVHIRELHEQIERQNKRMQELSQGLHQAMERIEHLESGKK